MSLYEDHRSGQGLRDSIRFYGSPAKMSRALKIDHSIISRALSGEKNLSVIQALKIERDTKRDFESLSRFTKEEIDLIKKRDFNLKQTTKIALENIKINPALGIRSLDSKRDMILGPDQVLIAGLCQLAFHKAMSTKTVSVKIVDLIAIWLETTTLSVPDFLMSERVNMGLWLEDWYGNRAGSRTDLGQTRNRKKDSVCSSPRPPLDEVKGRKDIKIARLLGFGSKSSYHNAKLICSLGIPELIEAVDAGTLPLSTALKIAKKQHKEQAQWISQQLKGALSQ